MTLISVWADETDPDTRLAWYVEDGSSELRDFSGWTLTVEVLAENADTIEYTKSSGVTGGDGSGAANVNVAWTHEELEPLAGSRYRLRVLAALGSETAVFTLDSRGTLPFFAVKAVPVVA